MQSYHEAPFLNFVIHGECDSNTHTHIQTLFDMANLIPTIFVILYILLYIVDRFICAQHNEVV